MNKTVFLLLGLLVSCILSAQSYNLGEAKEAIHSENYEKALDYLNRDIKDFPKKAESHYYRAYVYFSEQKYAVALTELSTAFDQISRKEKEIQSDCYSLMGKIYASIDNNEKAISNYNAAIQLNPKNAENYLNRAQAYSNSKQYDKAEKDFKHVLMLNEGELKAWTGIGCNYLDQERYTEAGKIFDQLAKLSPEYPQAYYYKAKTCYAQNKKDEAINTMFQSLILDETNDSTLYYFEEYAKSNCRLAVSNINAKLVENPDDYSWIYLRGKLSENTENYTSAIADFSKALVVSGIENKNDLLFHRANCYSESGLYKHAIADYTQALSTDSTLEYYWGYRGYTKQQMGDYVGAITDFTKAISINPQESWFYYRRGWLKDEFLKNHDAGLEDYNQAIAIDKSLAYAYLNRGRLYSTTLKDTVKAKSDFEMILKIDTLVNEQGNVRQYALMELGRNDEAINWLSKIIEKYPLSGNYYDAACLYSRLNLPAKALYSIKMAFENGYRSLNQLSKDDDLDNVRKMPEFTKILDEWKNKLAKDETVEITKDTSSQETVQESIVIPMNSKSTGVYELSCKINELALNFIFDTGASNISISQTEVDFMLKNGYLNKTDILGSQNYHFANGDVEVGTRIMLRKVNLGGFILHNVIASVVQSKKAPLLLGQSALSKYGKIVIDNEKKTITINSEKTKN